MKMTDGISRVISYMKENKSKHFTSKQIAEILNIRYNIANKILRILYKNNEIRATKKGKYTYYYR